MTTSQSPTHSLLAISIGPVQEFIAASRKARDLWYGSDLLSRLSRKAAESLSKNDHVALIFPAKEMLAGNASVANKLLVEVRGGEPAELAREARAAVQTELTVCWTEAKQRSNTPVVNRVVDQELLSAQLTDFVEWYAAWIPFDPDETNPAAPASYAARRAQVELLLAGRKALRNFSRAHGVDGLPKSSLDPSRETVLLKAAFNDLQESERRALRLKLSEQLDGVSLIKRLGGTNRIASVSRVAIDPFLRVAEEYGSIDNLSSCAEKLQKTELVEAFSANDPHNHLERYSAFPYDCQLFYEPSAASVCEQFKEQLDAPLCAAVKEFIGEVRELAKEVNLSELPSYMAVLVADGDRMGKALGTLTTPDDHIIFSQKLVGFADAAIETVKAHFGVTIYTGGDDVLAFLPLDTALLCAEALRHDFATTMKTALPDDFPLDDLPTLSVGIAISHFSDHLQVLLQRGRDAEKRAKVERNSLAVSFTPRSGGTHIVSHRWSDEPVTTRWWRAIDALHHDAIPDGAVYELGDLCTELAGMASRLTSGFPADFVSNEVNRILKRKRTRRGADAIHTRVQEEIEQRLARFSDAGQQVEELRTMVEELYIARRMMPVFALTRDAELPRWEAAGANLAWLETSDETRKVSAQ